VSTNHQLLVDLNGGLTLSHETNDFNFTERQTSRVVRLSCASR
jgi:hypothetical protein